MMENTEVNIRKAKRDDMLQVYKLVKELAEFEKMADQMKIGVSVLEKDGFDTDNPAFSCYVAELPGNNVVGYALYFTCYSTWIGKSIFLEDLYVQPAFRNKGIGRKLFMTVAKVAYELTQRMDFHVLSWNPAIKFYESLGAINLSSTENWRLFRLDEQYLKKLFN